MYTRNYYRMESRRKLPIKWMAPECLNDTMYNEMTDVVRMHTHTHTCTHTHTHMHTHTHNTHTHTRTHTCTHTRTCTHIRIHTVLPEL